MKKMTKWKRRRSDGKRFHALLTAASVVVMLTMLAGCGQGEAVSADIEAQGEEKVPAGAEIQSEETVPADAETQSEETAPANAETQSKETDGDAVWQGSEEEESGAEGQKEPVSSDSAAAQPEEMLNASRAQLEIDEETRNELTAELLEENNLDASVVTSTRTTRECTFDLPEGFAESEETKGMYVTGRYPLDASTIYYAVGEQDIALQLLTKEAFKEQTQESLRQMYGEDTEVTVDSFESIKISGYPAFRILCHYQIGRIQITQLEYAVNADKSYMITYSQTGDYDHMGEYEASAATISVR